ncbi:MAG: glycosyltransferase family 1 protein [Anaerolineae bacterium]|nr:glycosyltransferase family 1 protein [Anaerolineae bacterium]
MEKHMTGSNTPQIVINGLLMSGSATYRSAGISTYISNLVANLHPDSTMVYHIVIGRNTQFPERPLPTSMPTFSTDSPVKRIIWEQFFLPTRLKYLNADILHAPAFVGPLLASCPQVITVHDLSFIRFPHFFRRYNRVYLNLMTGISCRRAASVIAVSDFTAAEVNQLLGIPRSKIRTVYHGVDPKFKPLPDDEVQNFRRRRGLPDRFILFLGTLEPRKNIAQLIKAYAQLKDKRTHLVLAGAKGWYYGEIYKIVADLALQNYVHFPGYVPAGDQALWYNAATAFAYLSTYEGFGLPVIEALACGVPTLTSTSSSLPEAAGDGALQAKCDDQDEIVGKLHLLLSDASIRQSLREKGLHHARKFTWHSTATNTVKVYHEILARH